MSELLEQSNVREVDTVVVPLAGLGTRMHPFTMDNPKFMAPVYDTYENEAVPNVDYTFKELVSAEVKNVICVVNPGGETVLRRHLGPMDPQRESDLRAQNKLQLLKNELRFRSMFANVNFSFVVQELDGPYGTAVPVGLVRKQIESGKTFSIWGGDDFFWHPNGSSELASAIASWRNSNAENAIVGKPVAREDGPRYGILQANKGLLERIVEKPPLQNLPEGVDPLANVSRYIVGEAMWEYLDRYLSQPSTNPNDEYYFTDVVNLMVADGHDFHVHAAQNMYFDAGTVKSITKAGVDISKARAEWALIA